MSAGRLARPGDVGVDVMQYNLHNTACTIAPTRHALTTCSVASVRLVRGVHTVTTRRSPVGSS